MTYTNHFGGENVNPADLSYMMYDFDSPTLAGITNVPLQWPFEALDGSHIVADKVDVKTTLVGSALTMPDAMLVSVGEDVLWNNVGTNPVTVLAYDGSLILHIVPGTQWYIYLVNNDTAAGTWRATQLGAATSVANASALAGYGLRATVGGLIDQNLMEASYHSGNYTFAFTDRAQVFRNEGGEAVHTFPLSTALGPVPSTGNGWFVIEINAGGGNVILTPTAPELIDGEETKTLGPDESCVVYCFGSGFATMGHGRSISSNVTSINIDASGTGETTLSLNQVSAQVQNYTGAPTPPRTFVYGPGDGYWFVKNETIHPLQFKGATSDSTLSIVDPANFSILRSNGGELDIAFTATSGTVTRILGAENQISTSPPSPSGITSTGTIDLTTTGVADGFYGGVPSPPPTPAVTKIPRLHIDDRGRARSAENVDVAITTSNIIDMNAILGLLLPTGSMIQYAGHTLPPITNPGTGFRAWLLCDGSVVDKALYPALWAAIGGTYGAFTGGTGGTGTFTLPDTRGRMLAGREYPVDSGRIRQPYFVSGHYATNLGAVGGVDMEQAGVPLSGVRVSGGDHRWGYPYNFGWLEGFGVYGYLVGNLKTSNTTGDASSFLENISTQGGSSAAQSHTHTYSHQWPLGTGFDLGGGVNAPFMMPGHIDGSHGWGGGRFIGQVDYDGASQSVRRYTDPQTNMPPTLIVHHIIKT